MSPEEAIEIGREAILMMLLTSAPVLITGLVIGLLAGIFQAITQIQEQSISFVPKIVAVVIVISLILPWLVHQLVQYSHDLINNIPSNL